MSTDEIKLLKIISPQKSLTNIAFFFCQNRKERLKCSLTFASDCFSNISLCSGCIFLNDTSIAKAESI